MGRPSQSVGPRGPQPGILVIRSGAIGDTLMATPLFRSLRRSFPDAYIAALTSDKATDVLKYNPHVDEVLSLRHRHLPFFLSREKRRLLDHFRERGLDTVLSLESHRDFTHLARRLGPQRLVTYDPRASGESVTHLAVEAGEHSAEMHLRAGTSIGAAGAGLQMEFHYPADLKGTVASRLKADGILEGDMLIGLHAGWGGRRQDPEDTRLRSWPASRFAEVMRKAAALYGAKFVLTGSGLDRELNENIIAAAGVKAVNAAGRFSLLETAALIDGMDLYLSIDSGPAHIAAAVGTPLITLWGPGIFTATRPLPGRSAVSILREPPPCAPCYGTELMKTCRDNICMKNIGVQSILDEIGSLLSRADR